MTVTVARPPSSNASTGAARRSVGPAVGRAASPIPAPISSGAASTTRSGRRSSTASSSRAAPSTTARVSARVGRHPWMVADGSFGTQRAATGVRTAVGGAGTSASMSRTTSSGEIRRSHISGLRVIRWPSTATATALTSSGVT